MLDQDKFRYYVKKSGHTLDSVANEIGVNPATLSRKIAGESDFKRNEIQLLRALLQLSSEEAEDIFFAK